MSLPDSFHQTLIYWKSLQRSHGGDPEIECLCWQVPNPFSAVMCSTSRTTPRKHFQGGINVDGDKVAEKWRGLWLDLFRIHVWSSHWLVYKGVRFLEYVSLINRNYKPGFLNTFTQFPGRFYVTDVFFSPPLWPSEFCWKDRCIKVQMRVLHTKGSQQTIGWYWGIKKLGIDTVMQ